MTDTTHRHEGPFFDYAPTSEQGVVVLFGLLLPYLPYRLVLDEVKTSFPDCLATRENPDGSSELIRVEFEHLSANFVEHGHPMDCDLIVCWKDNLHRDFPIKRLALQDVIKTMGFPIFTDPEREKYEKTLWDRDTFLAQCSAEMQERHEELLDWAAELGRVQFGEGDREASWNLYFSWPAMGTELYVLWVGANGQLGPAKWDRLPLDLAPALWNRLFDAAASRAQPGKYFYSLLEREEEKRALMEGLGEIAQALQSNAEETA